VFLFAGYIDLSKRRVSAEEVNKCGDKYAKAKAVSMVTKIKFKVKKILNVC
jgi:translation initiation factor 2 alpha subunit (eIF-2alpha)